jgi:putative MFS transporter
MVGRIATIFSPWAVVTLFVSYGVSGVTGSLAVLFLFTAAVLAIFGIETRRKPLEAINPEGSMIGEPAALGSP